MSTPVSETHYRIGIALRVLAASLGGYVLTALVTALLAHALPATRAQAVLTATMLSFAFYAAIVVWVFTVRSTARVWQYLGAAIVVAAVALFFVQRLS